MLSCFAITDTLAWCFSSTNGLCTVPKTAVFARKIIKYPTRMFTSSQFTLLGGVIVSLIYLLNYVGFWQRKEYRLDRVRSVLASAERYSLLTPAFLLGSGLVAVAWIGFWLESLPVVEAASWTFLLLHTGYQGSLLVRRGLARPVLTLKATTLLAISIVVTVLFAYATQYLPVSAALRWATIIFFVPYIVSLAVCVNNVPYALRKRSVIARARAYRATLRKLTVIGITGSFGKTSTKFFTQQLIGDQPGVVVTAEHRNDLYVIAQDMLGTVRADTRFYVVEMGAYRRGEIRTLAALVQPKVGVITAIGNQHLALFGSHANILQSKWELIESLPRGGTAILNADDSRLRQHEKPAQADVIWFSTTASATAEQPEAAVQLRPSAIEPDHIQAKLTIGTFTSSLRLPLLSEALLPSAAAAASIAHKVGVSGPDIAARLQQLTPYPHTMQLREGYHGAVVIDDSYSANEMGVRIAVQHLSRFADKKPIVALRPLEELGAAGARAHVRVGAALGQLNCPVFLVNRNYFQALSQGVASVPHTRTTLHVYSDPHQLRAALLRCMSANSVVLLEGRLPDVVRNAVINTL